MFRLNQDYLKLPGSYLFSTIGKKAGAYRAAHPDRTVISLGIGDVTQPLVPAVIDALHRAVDEMGHAETFRGYAPDLGYAFLRDVIAGWDYRKRGCEIAPDEIFISDGAKGDSANIQELFSADAQIAVCDPVYPVYVDSNVMAGRTGTYDAEKGTWSRVIYMPCTEENGFCPELPEKEPDLIYLCFPNNPTGSALTKDQLQVWVDYANRIGAVIIYDAAYRFHRDETRICGHPEGSEKRRCNGPFPVGKTSRDKIQRCSVHCTESGGSGIYAAGAGADPRTGRFLYGKCPDHTGKP